ncbi:MAG: M48 family metallopeptidase, partial [Thermodesulfobacteriota bacterium]
KNDSINAFALPGGSIVVFEGLIKATKRPEELAGVLAHEIQHIEQRHSTKIILRETSIGFLVSAVTGTSEGFDIAFKAARTIGGLGYRRQEEESADVEGLKLMVNARIDPYGMIDFFKLIRDKYGKFPKLFEYFSTHPNTNNRIETLDNLIKGYSYKPEKLLSGVNWEEVKNICETTEQE